MQLSYSLTQVLVTSLVLGLVTMATIVGNVFVIAAICLERHLRANVANYLIASLAVADLLVAVLVMPLAAVNDLTVSWFLGPEVCDAWISFDVLCCTSSILHLVAISLDRYWAVTRVDYIHNRSAKRILAMIAISWTMSAVISVPPLFGLKHSADYLSSLEEASSLTLPSAADFAWNSSTVMAASTFFHASSSSVEGRSVLDADFEYENARTLPSKVWNDRHPVVEHHLLISLFRTFFRREPSTAVDGDGVALAAAETSSCDFINGARTKRFIDAVYQSSVNASDDGISPSPIFECVISQDIGYTVFSTVGAFYLPLAFITAVYLNVYRVARSRIHRKQFNNRKQQYHRGGGGGGPAVDADVDQPSGRVDLSSSLERDMGSNLLRVFGGLRARLSTGSTSSVQPATSGAGFGQSPTIDRRAASFNNGNFPLGHHHHHHLSTATATGRSTTADRANATNTSGIYQNYLHPQASPTHQQQQQQQLMVNQSTPRQYLSVDVSPRLSESSSPPSTPSSRGGSWIYLTREYFLDVLSRRPPNPAAGADPSELRRYRERRARGRRERKAARTLAVITGTFVVCWLPFFIIATVRPFCGARCRSAIPRQALSVISWLGYGNSLVNPLIYTVFNPDFRRAFRRLLRLDRVPAAAGGAGGAGGGIAMAVGRQGEFGGRSTGGNGGLLRPDAITHIDVRSSAVTV